MRKLIKTSTFILGKIIALIFFALVVIITIQIVGRSILKISTPWTEEVAKYLLIWMTFLGSPVVLYRGEHLMVDLFYVKFPPRVRHWVHMFSDFFILIFCCYLSYFGIMLCLNKFVLNFVSPAAGIPRVYIYSALPVGAVLMLIYTCWDILETILIMLGKKEDTTVRTLVDENKTLAEIDSQGVSS
jgi:TRAP-type C4-dicarboxylate transport system permease small subunit